ncbi:MAG: T9SS type A sorting domain-containing protein [Bacteroidota bacterium]
MDKLIWVGFNPTHIYFQKHLSMKMMTNLLQHLKNTRGRYPLVLASLLLSSITLFAQSNNITTLDRQMSVAKVLEFTQEPFGILANAADGQIEVRMYLKDLYNETSQGRNENLNAFLYGIFANTLSSTTFQNNTWNITPSGSTIDCDETVLNKVTCNAIKREQASIPASDDIKPRLNGLITNDLNNQLVDVVVEVEFKGTSSQDDVLTIVLPGVEPITFDDDDVIVYLNNGTLNQQKYSYNLGQSGNPPTIDAVMGDQISIRIKTSLLQGNRAGIEGLPDVWIAQFAKEIHFMCSPSIIPGGYRPWIPFNAGPHVVSARSFENEVVDARKYPLEDGFQIKYPDWKTSGDYTVLDWTLQRAMDASQNDQPARPYWWSYNGKLRFDNVSTPQRAGKAQGLHMGILNAMRGTLDDNYFGNPYDDQNYVSLVDPDDIFYMEYDPLNQAGRRYDMLGNNAEFWKQVPGQSPVFESYFKSDGYEQDNSISEMVTWYIKEKHAADPAAPSLPSDYEYQGYEIWEGLSIEENPYGDPYNNYNRPDHTYNYQTPVASKAPGNLTLSVNGTEVNWRINVESPITNDKFYCITGDVNLIRYQLPPGTESKNQQEAIVLTKPEDYESKLGVNYSSLPKTTDYELMALDNTTAGEFKLVYNEWNSKAYKKVALEAGLNTNKINFPVTQKGANAVIAYYRRNPNSPWVIMGGIDLASTSLNLLRCKNYANANESRGLSPREFPRNVRKTPDGIIEPYEYIQTGYEPNDMHGNYTVTKGKKIDFRVFDTSTFNFKSNEGSVNFYASNRLEIKRMTDLDLASSSIKPNHFISWKVEKIDPSDGTIISTTNPPNGATASFQTSDPGYYLISATYGNITTTSLIHVLDDNDHNPVSGGGFEKGKVLERNLNTWEKGWLGLEPDNTDYKLLIMTDVLSDYKYNDLTVRARHDASGNAVIDRFGPFNDYADHYTFQLNATGDFQSTQPLDFVTNFVGNQDSNKPFFNTNYAVAVHIDPLTQLATVEGYDIENLTSSIIQSYFNDVDNDLRRFPWELSVPWFSESKYHGLMYRNTNKPMNNMAELKKYALSGDYYNQSTQAPQYFKDFFANDEDKLRYEFYLNLKYARWVVVDENVNKIAFKHADSGEIIATKGLSNTLSHARIAEEDTLKNETTLASNLLSETVIYPNPTKGILTIKFGSDVNKELPLYIRLVTLEGKQVYSKIIDVEYIKQGSLNIDLTKEQSLVEGLYILNLSQNQNNQSRKRIIIN